MKVILGVSVIAALLSIGRFSLISARQLPHPVDVLNESLVLNTALLLHKGVNVYARETFDGPPFSVNLYTPLYFVMLSYVPGFANSPFITARAVSLIFMICALGLLLLPSHSLESFLRRLVGIGWLLLFSPFVINGAFVRMESLALFFSASTVTLLYMKGRQATAGTVFLTALCAFLAVMSKQSYIAAPISCFLYLLWLNRRRALEFAIVGSLLIGISFYWLNEWSRGGFLWSTMVAPQAPISLDWYLNNIAEMRTPAFVVLLLLSSFACYSLMKASVKTTNQINLGDAWRWRLSAIYFLIAWIWLGVSIGRVGAYPNYFIEPLFASIWILLTWADRQDHNWTSRKICRSMLTILPVIFAWEAWITRDERHLVLPQMHPPQLYKNIRDEMENLGVPPSPKILNLVDHRIALSVGWDLYVNDTFWYTILWDSRTLSNQSMIAAIDHGYFDLVALKRGTRAKYIPEPTPTGEIHQKIFERYEFKADNTFAYYVRRGSRMDAP